jgi:hypothetical protein
MYMVRLDVQRSDDPALLRADAADFLFKKRRQFPNQNLFALFGTPDKMVSELIRDMFGMLCIHTPNYNMCSNSLEGPPRAALPLDES